MVKTKIVNKSKQGITLKTKNIVQKISWEEFNQYWTIDPNDKFLAIMKPEAEAEAEKANELVQNAVVALMMGRGNNPQSQLTSAMMLGNLTDQFCQLVPKGTPAEFMQLVRMAYKQQVDAMLGMGVGFTHKNDDNMLNGRQRRQNKRNLERLHKKDDDKFTIGDAILAQAERDKCQKSSD